MAGSWLLLLLALGCPALPTGVSNIPFPSLAPPITLLVDGKEHILVVCLVLDIASPGLESSIWFSAGNGSALEAFTYGPSPAADGTWTSLAQLSLPSEELAAWENLVCHTGPGAGDHSQSTQPLQLSGETSSARNCLWEPLRGDANSCLAYILLVVMMPDQELRLGALRLLLFKLLLFDVLLTCSHLRALPASRGNQAPVLGPRNPGFPAPPTGAKSLRVGGPFAPTDWSRRSVGGPQRPRLTRSTPQALQPLACRGVHTCHQGPDPRSTV